jgi:hypothetical protein
MLISFSLTLLTFEFPPHNGATHPAYHITEA